MKQQKSEVEAEELTEFLGMGFSAEILEIC